MLLDLLGRPPLFLYAEADSGTTVCASSCAVTVALLVFLGFANAPNTSSAPIPVAAADHTIPVCIACTNARSA